MLALVIAFQLSTLQPVPAPVRIIDGDTIEDGAGEIYRLAGVDAPEIRGARCRYERVLGIRARDALAALVASASRVEARGRARDRYNRRIVHILADGADVGATLIAAGHGRPWTARAHVQADFCVFPPLGSYAVANF